MDENKVDEPGLSPLMAKAVELGRAAGKAQASWVFDGNTSRETYAWFLKGIGELDSKVMDSVREPSLSGEFAGDYTEADLWDDLGLEVPGPDDPEDYSEYADAYLEGARCAFWETIELTCKYQLS